MFRVMSFLPLNELPALFPHVVDWILYIEKRAQDSGRALTPAEFNLAQNVGVDHPEQVRILSAPRVPLPSHRRVKRLAKEAGLLTADTGSDGGVRRHCSPGLHKQPSAAGARIRSRGPV
jgi:hypothetical protein